MRTKITLDSGSILELDYCKFNLALKLFQKIVSLAKNNITTINFDTNLFEKIKNKQITTEFIKDLIPQILSLVCDAFSDQEVYDLIIQCGNQSLINGERITIEYFENVEYSGDFFSVLYKIAEYNLSRFFPQAPTKSNEQQDTAEK